ncbi:MAG TPA: MFS transporter [Ktedonosporobacter sp.]|nr:MFS transporter [Ktedonosporobacter sp.]
MSARSVRCSQERPAGISGGLHVMARAFTALRHRNFRLFWFGQLISLIGTWMQSIGQAWLVLVLSHNNALLLGIVGALQFLPVLILSLLGGVIADRFPKRRVLIGTQSSAMLLAFILFVLTVTHVVQIWHILVLATLLGVVNAVDMPTRQSFVVEMVGREEVMNAVALNSSLFNTARIIGPGIGGLVIGWLGVAPLFLLNGISFIAVIIGLALIRPEELLTVVRPKRGTGWRSSFIQLGEGLRYVRQAAIMLTIVLLVAAVGTFALNFNVILPLFAADILRVGASGYGVMSAVTGLGSLVAALVIAATGRKPRMNVLLISGAALAACEIGFALSRFYPLSLLLLAGIGFTTISFSATANTALQTGSPDHLRGRIMGLYVVVFAGTTPIGNLFTGGLAARWGPPISLIAGAVITAVAVVLSLRKRGQIVTPPAGGIQADVAPEASLPESLRASGEPTLSGTR